MDFKLYCLLMLCSGDVRSKNGVDLVKVSIFYKAEKMSGQTYRPIKIMTVALFCLIMDAKSSNFFCSFCYVLDISSPKMKSLRWKHY